MTVCDAQKIAHESLLRELHNIDQIVETQTQIVIIIIAALVGFVSVHLDSSKEVFLISIFGLLISIGWVLQLLRYRYVFLEIYKKITELQRIIGIDAIRPKPLPRRLIFDGYLILEGLGCLFILFWFCLLLLYGITEFCI